MKHFPFIENDRKTFHVEMYLSKDVPCKDNKGKKIKYSDIGVMEYNHITKEKKVIGVTRQFYTLEDEYINHSSFKFIDDFKNQCLKGLDITIEYLKDSLEETWFELDLIIEEPQH